MRVKIVPIKVFEKPLLPAVLTKDEKNLPLGGVKGDFSFLRSDSGGTF